MSQTAVRIVNLHRRFGDNHVLRGVSLEVAQGETLAIIGGSGCGKSVLLRHIVGLLQPDAGFVEVLGARLTELSWRQLDELRHHISMVFQSAALLGSLTVAENVGLALREVHHLPRAEVTRIVAEKLELVNMRAAAHLKPESLSGGMRKRVALARALAMNPDIILYDEPTSELDPLTSVTIDQLLLDMKNRFHKTSIVVTHDMAHALTIADRICMLHEGQVIFDGSPDEIVRQTNPVIASFIRRGGTVAPSGNVLESEVLDNSTEEVSELQPAREEE